MDHSAAPLDEWYVVQGGDTCGAIEKLYQITMDQLVAWNLNLTSTCSNLQLGDAYCVAGPPPSSSAAMLMTASVRESTLTTSAGVTTTASH
jgi:LysM repeat protein